MWKKRQKEKGLSLLEVLIALSILSIAFLSLLGIFPASMRGVSESRNVYLATEIARNKLEYWKQQGYTWIVGSHSASDTSGKVTINSKGNGASQNTVFTWQVSYSNVVSGGVEQVDVLVSWKQAGATTSYQPTAVRETNWVKQ